MKASRSFILKYKYVQDFYYKRIGSHFEHIKYFRDLQREGVSVTGGTLFPENGGVFYIQGMEKNEIEAMVEEDPFKKKNLIQSFELEEIECLGKLDITGLS